MNWNRYKIPLFEGRFGRPAYWLAVALGLFVFIIVPVSCMQTMKADPGTTSAMEVFKLPEFDEENPPALKGIVDINARKAAFFEYLRPVIREENARILRDRKRLLSLYMKHLDKSRFPAKDLKWLKNLSKEYGVTLKLKEDKSWMKLIKRVDIVPERLALVQAAVESKWGTSRFAFEGNSFFGEWCYEKDCGMVPERRPKGKTHMVEVFGTVRESVKSYMNNLNTHQAYRDFRDLRYALRQELKPLDARKLVPGLVLYSERRDKYVRQIRKMMKQNKALLDG